MDGRSFTPHEGSGIRGKLLGLNFLASMPRPYPFKAVSIAMTLASWLIYASSMAASPLVLLTDRDVHVERAGDTFKVDVTMKAPVPSAQVWAVLVDFDHMAQFLPNMQSSEVIERTGNQIKVRQRGEARYGIFSTDYETVREVKFDPMKTIRARGLAGDFKHMDSLMELSTDGDDTVMHYHAEVEPQFALPPLIGPAAVRKQTADQFNAMLQEILRRH